MTTEAAFIHQLNRVVAVYDGSDGEKTKQLYQTLDALGPAGIVATNLFRASKNSHRAKQYRGGNREGSYSSQAYERKDWSIGNLCEVLAVHGPSLKIVFGWGVDAKKNDGPHSAVFYVDLPTGQVSFHTARRSERPVYPGTWDGQTGISHVRIQRWCAHLLSKTSPQPFGHQQASVEHASSPVAIAADQRELF